MTSIFGTDGIRGKFGSFPIDANTFFKIGVVIGNIFASSVNNRAIIAKDTRDSSDMLEDALVRGMNYANMEVISVDVLPTSSLSFFVPKLNASVGIMISASHNHYTDNGLKFFAHDGSKLSKKYEKIIEERLNDTQCFFGFDHHLVEKKMAYLDNANKAYVDHVSLTFSICENLNGMRIVLDLANGATTYVAEKLFSSLGATVFTYNNLPDGKNINKECGSVYSEHIKDKVLYNSADLGLCLDGDGDRVVICDEKGSIIDGDQLIAALTPFLFKVGLISSKKIVSTVMSSMALERFLKKNGFEFIRTDVGEHNILNKMHELGCDFGAENSGHFIIKRYSNTSDGLIAALQVLSLMRSENIPISDIVSDFVPSLVVMRNIYCKCDVDEDVLQYLRDKFASNDDSVLVIRKSGTERGIIRIMIEGCDMDSINAKLQSVMSGIHSYT